jgi:hypothetical protein
VGNVELTARVRIGIQVSFSALMAHAKHKLLPQAHATTHHAPTKVCYTYFTRVGNGELSPWRYKRFRVSFQQLVSLSDRHL